MHLTSALLFTIVLILIAGPVAGGLALALWLFPGVSTLVGVVVVAVIAWGLLGTDGIVRLGIWGVVALVVSIVIQLVQAGPPRIPSSEGAQQPRLPQGPDLSSTAEQNAAPGVDNATGILHRQKIEGTDLYQDQYGRQWRKVAGIFKLLT